MDFLFVFGRILLGGYFLMSGITHFSKTEGMTGYAQSRGMMSPKASVLLSGVFLLLGGLGVLLGVYVQIALALLVLFLLAAAFGIHHFWTDTDEGQKMSEMTNFMKNMALVGALLMLYMVSVPWPASF